jgi:hypothetical protein
MLIAPSVWNVTSTQVTGKFRILKLNLPQQVQFVMERLNDSMLSCSITYDDSKEAIVIPFDVVRFLYCLDESKRLFVIPIQWDFEKYCDIELTTTDIGPKTEDWSMTKYITCNIGDGLEKISNFWASTEYKLEPKQLIRLVGRIGRIGNECEQVIVAFSKIVSVLGLNKGRVLDTMGSEMDGLEKFVTNDEMGGSFKVYTKGYKPIQVEVVTKRKVVMLFEDPQNKCEFKEPITECNDLTIPEWIGQTLVYRNFENFFDIGRHISHVYFPTILDPVKKPQVACLLGLSLSALETMMFENREKIYICAELSAPFSLK